MIKLSQNLLESCKSMSYHEKKFCFDKDVFVIATEICEENFYDDYVMYENKGEISIGIGRFATVIVTPNEINLEIMGEIQHFKKNDISIELKEIFKSIDLKNWRAYGIANFGLACHNYKLPLRDENKSLIKMFIPKIDIRLVENKILVRALDTKDLSRVEKFIEKLENNLDKKEYLQNESNKIKLKVPEILEQKAETYKDIVSKGVEDIKSRKYEKVILSRKILLNQRIDMLHSYIIGRRENSPARSYALNLGGLKVIGYSPETVAEVSRDGYVSTFPLAGTRAMGKNREETKKLKEELLADPKEIAEHAVSVKLAYEELEKVCELNSVSVIKFMSVLERGTVQHLASRLKGKLKEEFNEWHAFNALFPAVTASGIPKKQSIDAIIRLENEARDLYSGSVLTYDFDGTMDASLVLRSVYQDEENTWLRAGAGIVKLSKPERELEETREKLRSVSKQLVNL